MIAIPPADYYTTDDGAEELTWDQPEDALQEWADGLYDAQAPATLAADVRRYAPITLHCYEREKMADGFVENCARNAVERASEDYGEDYAGPDGVDFGETAHLKAISAVEAALRELFESVAVWRCKQTAKVELSAADVLAMLGEADCPVAKPEPVTEGDR